MIQNDFDIVSSDESEHEYEADEEDGGSDFDEDDAEDDENASFQR